MRNIERRVIFMAENDEKEKLRVILCRPGEAAEVVEIEDDLESMQELVGGLIEPYDPFYSESDPRYENVILVCNEEGKLMNLPPSRAIVDENGRVMDVIRGPFFLCYAPVESERFMSIPPDLEEEFRKKYERPEKIFRTETGIEVIRYDPGSREREHER